MYILIGKLYQDLREANKILIYGAGVYANTVYPMLKKMGLKEKIISFVVTNKKNEVENIDGIQVRSINKIKVCDLEQCMLLIAVDEKKSHDIIKTLCGLKLKKVLLLTDYIIEDIEIKLRELSNEQFVKYIREGYLWNSSLMIQEYGEGYNLSKDFIEKREGQIIDRKTIVFVLGWPSPRILKIIGALVRKSYKIIVLGYGNWGVYNHLTKEELFTYDIEFLKCKDIFTLFYLALQYKPLLYYFEPEWGNYSWAALMIKHQDLFGKIVISIYDILNDCYVQVSEKQRNEEKYSLENAAGIVWRYFSKEFLEEKKGFEYKGKSIHFLDYCNDYKLKKIINQDQKLKICFVCGDTCNFLDEIHTNDSYYAEVARIDTILKILGNREDCLFHVFAGRSSEQDKEKCDNLEKQYFNFKIFYGTKHEKLIEQISEYDYGCFFYTNGKMVPDMATIDNKYYGSVYVNSISNRHFDYIEAGIPIIATKPTKLCEFFERYGILVKMDTSNIDIEFLKKRKKYYRNNVEKARKDLLIDKQIQRLIDFFDIL